MGVTVANAKLRWARLSKEERRLKMEPLSRASVRKAEAVRLAKSVRHINAHGGWTEVIARVQAAGLELEVSG